MLSGHSGHFPDNSTWEIPGLAVRNSSANRRERIVDIAEEMIPFVVIGVWKDFPEMDGVLLGPGDSKVV